MIKNKDTVCAVVVTHNRKQLLIECLDALRRQTRPIQAIYIVDNFSTDGTPEALKEYGYIDELPPSNLTKPLEIEFKIHNLTDRQIIKIYYVRMNENTGSSGGFYEGVKRGYEREYDWLWLMDDDGMPDNNCLEILLSKKDLANFLAPLVVRIDNPYELSFGLGKNLMTKEDCIKNAKNGILYNVANPFNGILISNNLIKKIGYPKKEMFIWGDEIEYYIRAIKSNLGVVTVVSALHFHPKGKIFIKSIFRGHFNVGISGNTLRDFCMFRNNAYIAVKYKKFDFIREFMKYVWFFLITKKFNIKGLSLYIKATIHGLLGIWGGEKRYLR